MAVKRYSPYSIAPGLVLHHPIVSCHKQDTHWGEGRLTHSRDAVDVFYSPSQMDSSNFKASVLVVDYIVCLFVWLSKSLMEWSSAQPVNTPTAMIVPTTVGIFTAWTSLIIWYMQCKLACTKILQNFWLTLIISNPWSVIPLSLKSTTLSVLKYILSNEYLFPEREFCILGIFPI